MFYPRAVFAAAGLIALVYAIGVPLLDVPRARDQITQREEDSELNLVLYVQSHGTLTAAQWLEASNSHRAEFAGFVVSKKYQSVSVPDSAATLARDLTRALDSYVGNRAYDLERGRQLSVAELQRIDLLSVAPLLLEELEKQRHVQH